MKKNRKEMAEPLGNPDQDHSFPFPLGENSRRKCGLCEDSPIDSILGYANLSSTRIEI